MKDLVPYARRSLHGFLVQTPEPIPGQPELYRASFGCMGLPLPHVDHAQWDWGDCTGRAVQAWLFLRRMTGERDFGRKIEEGQRATLQWLLTPEDGMPCVPERSHPEQGIYHYQMWDQGRTLRALVRWWLAEADPVKKAQLAACLDRMSASLRRLATRGHDPEYGDYAVYPWDCITGDQAGDDLYCMRGGQLLEPLALYWAASGSAAARQFADEICAGVLSGHEADTYPEPTRRHFFFGAEGSFGGHFHDHVSIALGVARFGQALYRHGEQARGLQLLRWARRVYDWTLAPENVNAGSSWGWFPENVGLDNTQARELCEICCVADMIELAAVLAQASRLDPRLAEWDALWDHVERYTFNTIRPAQFMITPRYREIVAKVLAARPVVRNRYVEFEVDANGCYNHELTSRQTLRAGRQGHLSQLGYAVGYSGRGSGYVYVSGQPMRAQGFVTEQAAQSNAGVVAGVVRTEDGAVRLAWENRCGQGPYVVRCFRVSNAGQSPLPQLRFACVANLDFSDYARNEAVVDESLRRARVVSTTEPGALGLAGEPPPDYMDVGDAVERMNTLMAFHWDNPRRKFRGNAAVTLGWELGPLAPGEEKVVAVTLAVAAEVDALARALRQDVFPDWALSDEAAVEAQMAVARRLEGAWVAAFPPNDLAARSVDGSPYMNMMGCCHFAGVRGLYTCWEAAVAEESHTLRVRLPVCRESDAVSQRVTEGPHGVEQRLKVKATRELWVRIPAWADLERVQATGGGQQVTFRLRGRWLGFGPIRRGTEVLIRYPCALRTTQERVGGNGKSLGFCPAGEKRTFTARWRGNIVVSLEPQGEWLPIFSAR